MGSIWNKGNWHWEERNYKEFAKEFLSKNFCGIVATTPDSEISVYEVKKLEGTASVTIRKQKQIFMYEFEGELYFKAHSLSDDRTSMMGRLILHEFS